MQDKSQQMEEPNVGKQVWRESGTSKGAVQEVLWRESGRSEGKPKGEKGWMRLFHGKKIVKKNKALQEDTWREWKKKECKKGSLCREDKFFLFF